VKLPDAVTTIGEALKRAERTIERVDAVMLMCHALGKNRAFVLAHLDDPLSDNDLARFELSVAARNLGTPIAYTLGTREFYGRDFVVTPNVLIPRPETEVLVEHALARLSATHARKPPWILDLGTGSGAIAVTLAMECPSAHIIAVDASQIALRIAKQNALRHFHESAELFSLSSRKKVRETDRSTSPPHASIEFVESDWYSALAGKRFDLVVSNPPYVAAGDAHLAQGDLRFEPRMALTDESRDGLGSIRTIVNGAPDHLNPGGWIIFEHGYDQADACQELLLTRGFGETYCVHDLAGVARVAGGKWLESA
jgi:release factor glutamine methyltransferase